MSNISILGAGAFGTAIATILSENGHNVLLWAYEKKLVANINNNHENNLYLSGVKLSSNIKATNNLEKLASYSNYIFSAIPVKFLHNILLNIKPFIQDNHIFISLSKGIENNTLMLPSQIINSLFSNEVLVLSGPNFAQEIANKKYTASVLAANNIEIRNTISKMISNNYFKIELSKDIIGIGLVGALKNILSVLVGIAKGYESGENTIAFLLTKGLQEMTELVEFLGGDKESVYGLAGLGDLILSAFGSLGRNLKIGKEIGILKAKNNFNCDIFFKGKILPEGINTIKSLKQYIDKNNLNMPLINSIYKLIYERIDLKDLLNEI